MGRLLAVLLKYLSLLAGRRYPSFVWSDCVRQILACAAGSGAMPRRGISPVRWNWRRLRKGSNNRASESDRTVVMARERN